MSFKMEGNLKANLPKLDARVRAGMVAAANYTANEALIVMKTQAPWTDRTGAARNGLGVQVIPAYDRVVIVLFHSVSYGVFLELRWGGKYAIIEPTIVQMGPVFAQAIKRLAFGK